MSMGKYRGGMVAGICVSAAVCAACIPTTQAESKAEALLPSSAPSAPIAESSAQANSPSYIWIEAEKPKSTNFPPSEQNPFKPNDAKEAAVLSEGNWIGASNDRTEPLFLEYEVTVPTDGNYQLYARKFWKHGPYRWRFDTQPWQQIGGEVALLDGEDLRQFIGANWTSAGGVALKAGKHTLRIESTENKGAIAFDCFLLTKQPFTARGKLKPGEKYNRAPSGWFAFEPNPETFAASPIDLRSLNEKFAGENGFIVTKGEEFVHSKTGKPVRFWAINTGLETVFQDRAAIDYFARSIAKQGVNLIRLHGTPTKEGDFRAIDKDKLDRIQYFVAAMKREGVYTCLSIYFPLWLQLKDADGFAGYDQARSKNPFSLLYFNTEFQNIYRSWWKALLTTPNPYAENKPLAEDPAVAMTEMVNEDSYLFWTFTPYENIPGPQMEILEKQFGDWLAKKYGSLQAAFTTWGGDKVRGDEPTAGRAGFVPLWQMFNNPSKRAQDAAVFLAENQKAFYEATYRYLKQDLGFKGSVYASNWITADARVLGPLDKWSNSIADFMDRHGYFGGRHEGERSGYALSKGDRYTDRSALLFEPGKPGEQPDYSLPIWDLRYNGKPSAITEINWPTPNRYRADLPLLSAAYGALQGTDAVFLFATGSPGWEQTLGKFSIRTPVIMGQFPAAALIFRQGLVKPSESVVSMNLPLNDLLALKGAPVTAPANLDELRAKDIPAGQTVSVPALGSLDPLAFAVGKVDMNISTGASAFRTADLSKFIDRTTKVVRSQTGELTWNWGQGRVAVIAPKATGVTGFLSTAGKIALKDITIESPLEYGAVLLVSLDDKPIAQSSKMLLQVMSEDTNYGWQNSGPNDQGLKTITELGGPPIVVKNLAGTISLRRSDAASLKVTALDHNGYPAGQSGTAQQINLKPNVLYYLINK